jgi:cytochrome c553
VAAWSAVQAQGGDAAAGRTKAQSCATCHGPSGISQMPNVPHLAGQPEFYTVEQLKAYRSGKRVHEVMNVVAKPLADADINDLAAWYASIEIAAKPTR